MTEGAVPKKFCSPLNFKNLSLFTSTTTLPATALNDKGENVIVSKERYEGDPTGYCFRIDTYQENGWIRTNRYYPNGLSDESYELGGPK